MLDGQLDLDAVAQTDQFQPRGQALEPVAVKEEGRGFGRVYRCPAIAPDPFRDRLVDESREVILVFEEPNLMLFAELAAQGLEFLGCSAALIHVLPGP